MEHAPRAAVWIPVPGRAKQLRGAHPEHPEPSAPPPLPAPRRMPERHSVRDQVLRALRGALVSGELQPGAVYSAPALAERFGVSATPVREAMQLLACDGAVEAMPNRGFRVAERSARDLAELSEVRQLIEVPVVLRLARTVPAERWETLRPLAAAASAAAAGGDRAAYAEADRAFHRALLDLAGNLQLSTVADELHRRAQWPAAGASGIASALAGRSRRGSVTAELLAEAKEHGALLEALSAGDLTAVERLIRAHIAGPGRG